MTEPTKEELGRALEAALGDTSALTALLWAREVLERHKAAQLKPCPFCGKTEHLKVSEAQRVRCEKCNAYGPGFGSEPCTSKISKWNERAS